MSAAAEEGVPPNIHAQKTEQDLHIGTHEPEPEPAPEPEQECGDALAAKQSLQKLEQSDTRELTLTRELGAPTFGLRINAELVVTKVSSQSAAWRAGLRSGVSIISINGFRADTKADVAKKLKSATTVVLGVSSKQRKARARYPEHLGKYCTSCGEALLGILGEGSGWMIPTAGPNCGKKIRTRECVACWSF